MKSRVRVMHKNEFERNRWSGGVTTELAIWPEEASYPGGPFTWRISTARVDAEETLFTALPGKKRILMLLEGEIRLVHEGHHSVELTPFEMDTFSGDWKTRSFGKGTDFNLMMDDTCFGELMHLTIPPGASFNVALQSDREFDRYYSMVTEAYYCLGGQAKVQFANGYMVNLQRGDLLSYYSHIEGDKVSFKIINDQREEAAFVRTLIYY